MNRLFVTFFFLSSLSGCATVRNDHFTTPVPVELGNSLAADAIKQLQTLYPPAHTKFNIDQPVPKTDSFGTSLVFQMREKGYAVQIIDPTQPAEALAGLSTLSGLTNTLNTLSGFQSQFGSLDTFMSEDL